MIVLPSKIHNNVRRLLLYTKVNISDLKLLNPFHTILKNSLIKSISSSITRNQECFEGEQSKL